MSNNPLASNSPSSTATMAPPGVTSTWRPSNPKGRSLILNGHIDVVPEGPHEMWSRNPFEPAIKGEDDKYLPNPAYKDVPGAVLRVGNLPHDNDTAVHAVDDVVLQATGPGADGFKGYMEKETRRDADKIVRNAVAAKFPDIRWIFSHAGGTLPFLTARLEIIARQRKMAGGAAPILVGLLRRVIGEIRVPPGVSLTSIRVNAQS